MTTIIYPYLAKQSVWHEIIYSIRSVEKHFKGDFEICIVGNMPKGIDPKKVTYIPYKKNNNLPYARYMDAQLKLLAAVNDNRVSEDFVCMYDDIYFNEDTNIDLIRYRSLVATKKADYFKIEDIGGNGSQEWKLLLLKSFEILRAQCVTPYDFETHFPRWVNKYSFLEVAKIFDLANTAYQRWTLYYSCLSQLHGLEVKYYNEGNERLKVGFYGNKAAVYDLKGYAIINHNDIGLNSLLKKKISDLFYKKSKFEL